MSLPIPLREDFDARMLRRLAKHSVDAAQTRRLLALAGIYDGESRAKAAETGGVGPQIIRDWVGRFNAKGPDGLINGKAPGQQPILNNTHRAALAGLIKSGPIPAIHGRLVVPPNITILPLPPKCPELNPQENVWQFMRDNWLSNRVFKSYDDILDHCCDAWNKLIDQPWRIMSIGLRDWAHQS